ncbi:MAG: hypothetical protein KAU03_05285 [Candidatus Altiarchaeales archaeon]|nr:hypothetical protein [Candidatus Altiarchaeales archaeon]
MEELNMEKKKIMVFGVAALLIIGLVSVALAVNMKTRGKTGHRFDNVKEKLCLPEDAAKQQVRAAVRGRIIERLGLPEDASRQQIRDAMRQERGIQHKERLRKIRDKLGLPAEATEEKVKEALQEWRQENKDLIAGFGHKRQGFRLGMRRMWGAADNS